MVKIARNVRKYKRKNWGGRVFPRTAAPWVTKKRFCQPGRRGSQQRDASTRNWRSAANPYAGQISLEKLLNTGIKSKKSRPFRRPGFSAMRYYAGERLVMRYLEAGNIVLGDRTGVFRILRLFSGVFRPGHPVRIKG
jgi:hypothetical protein